MLIAAITAILLMGSTGASWMLEQIDGIKGQIVAEVADDVQRKYLLSIVSEMKSVSKQYAKRDKAYGKDMLKMVQDYDKPSYEIGAAMLQANLNRAQYQQEMLAERFRMVDASNEETWKRIFPAE